MAERPVECTHCKKTIAVVYKEMISETINCFETCADCPILEQKLHGKTGRAAADLLPQGGRELCCSNCGTSLESVRTGNPLGCSACYDVFTDLLITNLIAAEQLPMHLRKTLGAKRSIEPLHVGKSPAQTTEITPSHRLTALNEALNEALKRENYEQAALLRDQIKTILEKRNHGKE